MNFLFSFLQLFYKEPCRLKNQHNNAKNKIFKTIVGFVPVVK